MTRHVLITGGAGFIGSHLVDACLGRGDRVSVLDNFSTGDRSNLSHVEREVEIHEVDLRDSDGVHKAAAGVEVVFHEGALPSVPRSIENPLASNAVNVEGTLNLLLAARDAGVHRVVAASSSSVYGDAPGMPRRESQALAPISPYAVSKLAAEQYGRAFAQVYGIEFVALRYFNVFGPRQSPNSQYAAAIPKFIERMLAGERPTIYGDGLQTRDFSYIDNVVECNMLAAEAPRDSARGTAYNCATGEPHTLLAVVDQINNELGSEIEPEFVDPRPGEVLASHADVGLARERLGFEPSVRLAQGVAQTIESHREINNAAGRKASVPADGTLGESS